MIDFSGQRLQETPTGFRGALGGSGPPGNWRLVLDDAPTVFAPLSAKSPVAGQRPVLAQLSRDRTAERYPLLILDEETFTDFTLTTRFKIVDGEVEQMAGVAFHLQDEQNYDYVRASALGTNIAFCRMVNGQLVARVAANVEIPRGVWHELTVESRGGQVRGLLNGKELLHVTPALGETPRTKGRIGFWTKSDAVSHFADLRVVYVPKESLAQRLVRETLQKYPRLQGVRIFAAAPDQTEPRVIASHDPAEIGQPAQKEVKDVIARSVVYHGKDHDSVLVTMPLHDNNGETVAAVKLWMKSFPGQTEKNALARALPIVKQMEARFGSAKELWQ